jgi:hypothetical protein
MQGMAAAARSSPAGPSQVEFRRPQGNNFPTFLLLRFVKRLQTSEGVRNIVGGPGRRLLVRHLI